tara:strand:- start:3710 stop:4285 length:576 start_codon:yes stop_codon:yes gene_type:complete
MTDVRLTALNPVDSQVYPVACNTSGELIVEQVDPGPDLTVTGNLTVDGTSTFSSTIIADVATFAGVVTVSSNINGLKKVSGSGSTTQPVLRVYSDTLTAYTVNLNANGSADFTDYSSTFAGINGGSAVFYGGDSSTTSESNAKFRLNTNGSASFQGDIICTDSSKGVVLTSPNGTNYRLSVANDGTLSTSV